MGKVKSFLYGFTVGGVAAGIAVILSTQKTGQEVRDDLRDKWDNASNSMDDIKIAINQAKNNINELKTTGLPLIKSTANDIKELVQTWKTQIQPNIGKLLEDSKNLTEESKRISLVRHND